MAGMSIITHPVLASVRGPHEREGLSDDVTGSLNEMLVQEVDAEEYGDDDGDSSAIN
jgi:hypothetical protein